MKKINSSSTVDSVDYDPHQQRMRVLFKSGELYEYDKVPPDMYNAMLGAESVGKFLHKYVKGKHQFRKIPN